MCTPTCHLSEALALVDLNLSPPSAADKLQPIRATRACSHIARSPTDKEIHLAFEALSSDELAACKTAHYEPSSLKNLKSTLRKWDKFVELCYGGDQPDITNKPELACKLVIEFLQGMDKSKPFGSVQAAKNIISHVNVNILNPANLDYTKGVNMKALEKYLVKLKKQISDRASKAAPKIRSVAYGKNQWEDMYEARASIPLAERTTEETLQLINMTIDAWGAPRTVTKEKMLMKHITCHRDDETDCIKDGKHGCGFKYVKNYLPDKTTLIQNPAAQSGELDTETTLYCQCHTDYMYCPVKILLEYTEALKDGVRTLKHTHGGPDGSWLGNPKAKSEKHKKPVAFDDLPLFREISVRLPIDYCLLTTAALWTDRLAVCSVVAGRRKVDHSSSHTTK